MTNLTEYSWYYCKMKDGDIEMLERGADYFLSGDVPLLNNEVEQVLTEVPSYEQWKMTKNLSERAHLEMYKARGEKVRLEKENTKLRQLLKLNNVLNKGSKSIYAWLKEDTAGEQKKLCADMFDKTVEMMSEINQVLGE